ncbi:MAG: GNAT family N-acetyltransferase [Clostridiales bacterium]|nr:GNAT family N-acetyltransferase [Clostridiales bacterium]
MVGFDVRGVKKEDYKDIVKLNPNISHFDGEDSLEEKTIIVAQLNDDVIGYLKYDVDENNRVKIVDLVVDEMYRGLGVGYQLISELEFYIRKEYINEILVPRRKFTKEEVNFYDRQGFKLDDKSNLEKKLN